MCKGKEGCVCTGETINRMKVAELLKEQGGKFVTVTFAKKDGVLRKMNGRFGVMKGVKGTGKAGAHKANPYMVMWDAQAKSFRMINLATVSHVCACGSNYKVE